MWDNFHKFYAEDEFDDDGLLVYQPPTLDEVWLDETEFREKKKWLCKQHDRGVEKLKAVERNIINRVPEGGNPNLPHAVASHCPFKHYRSCT